MEQPATPKASGMEGHSTERDEGSRVHASSKAVCEILASIPSCTWRKRPLMEKRKPDIKPTALGCNINDRATPNMETVEEASRNGTTDKPRDGGTPELRGECSRSLPKTEMTAVIFEKEQLSETAVENHHGLNGEQTSELRKATVITPKAEDPQTAVDNHGFDGEQTSESQKSTVATPKTEDVVPKQEIATTESPSTSLESAKCASPEPSCSICLGKMENKSFTNSCFHQFCFTCLLEWSKVKPECPLCKQPFKSIVHNVRSMEDYDQYDLRLESIHSCENPGGQRFRYRTTRTPERQRQLAHGRALRRRSNRYHNDPLESHTYESNNIFACTSDQRRLIYEYNIWAQTSRTSRFRECSPTFYSSNQACTHRLIPWLNRELNALEYGHQVAFLMELILSLILRFHIQSPEFEELVRPYFRSNTSHFIHEFYSFARSPYDISEYDRRVVYGGISSVINTSSSDSDVIYLRTTSSSSRPRWSRARLPTTLPLQPITIDADGGSALIRTRDFLQNVSGLEAISSPQPGPSGLQTIVLSTDDSSATSSTDNRSDTSDDDDSVEVLPHSSIPAGLHVNNVIKAEAPVPDQDENDDDCVIVGCDKRSSQRSPLAIIVISDSEDEVPTTETTENSGECTSDLPTERTSEPSSLNSSEIYSYEFEDDSSRTPSPKPAGHLPSVIVRPSQSARCPCLSPESSNLESSSSHLLLEPSAATSKSSKTVKRQKKHKNHRSRSCNNEDVNHHQVPRRRTCKSRKRKHSRSVSSSRYRGRTKMKREAKVAQDVKAEVGVAKEPNANHQFTVKKLKATTSHP